ncbi:MAG: ATP-binding protein, partial [Actinoplanes sp.]
QTLLQTIDEVIAEDHSPRPVAAINTVEAGRAHVRAISAKLIERDTALSGAETRFQLIADKSPVGIVFGDRLGHATYVNDRFTEIMGLAAAELLDLGWLRCTRREQHEEIRTLVRGEISQGTQRRYRGQVQMPGGSPRWLNVNVQATRDDEPGLDDGFIATIDDVTAVVEAEQRHRAAERQHDVDARIRATERLQSLSRLAGGVAHDFNNILGAMLGFETFVSESVIELIASGRPLGVGAGQSLLRDLEQIRKGGKRATDLTQQLLTFGSRRLLNLAPLNLNQAVRESCDLLARTTGDRIVIVTELAADLTDILAEPINIGQILLNLTVNARDAMPDGGTLTVTTAPVETPAGRHVRLTVRDTGEGMTPEVMDRALEPFFSTKTEGGGSGLGLATVYGIVSQLGGTVQIRSAPGRGTAITIDLPATDRTAQTPTATPVTDGGGTETILLAEDEDPLRETICRYLTRAGYTVVAAPDGPTALALAEAHPGPIDLLLSDVMMPGMPGQELAGQLQEVRPQTPVLLMSGYAGMLMNDHGALPAGMTVLAKPFTENEILTAIRSSISAR